MLETPDAPEPGMPDFLMDKVPYVKLKGNGKARPPRRASVSTRDLSACTMVFGLDTRVIRPEH